MNTYLFVGGDADGTWREVRGDHHFFKVVRRMRMSMRVDDRPAPTEAISDLYRRRHFRADGEDLVLYALDSLSDMQVMGRLVSAYRGADGG